MGHFYRESDGETEWMNSLNGFLKHPIAAILFLDREEYYLFDAERGTYKNFRHNFWEHMEIALSELNISKERMHQEFTREAVLGKLECQEEYRLILEGKRKEKTYRVEFWFRYQDERRSVVLASIQNSSNHGYAFLSKYENEYDELTKLYTKNKIFRKCRELLNGHPRDQFAMIHFDIRNFHLYNTFFGDEMGDKLLCDIADMFRKMASDYEYRAYGRIEADVFCIFFPFNRILYEKQLNHLLTQLKNYRDDFLIEPVIGVYFVKEKKMSIESMFTRAEIAAQANKNELGQRATFYNERMEQRRIEEQQLSNEMQTALERGQFRVFLQPEFSLQTGQVIGAEALVRWIHPEKGVILPGQFLPICERDGFIADLDRYVWEQVCRVLRRWKDEKRLLFPVSVNISRVSMYSQTTVQFFKDLIRNYEIEPRYLELELTETAYMDDPVEMKEQLRELQNFGFRILMDDFGSGYSSLNTLKELPMDGLKLDLRFLANSSDDMRGRMVLSSIIRMTNLLDLDVIAEAVEIEEQADFLRRVGCQFAQGFLYAQPMPIPEYEEQILEPALEEKDQED